MTLQIPEHLSGNALWRFLHARMLEIFEEKNTDYAGKERRHNDPWANFRHAETLGVPAYVGAWIRKIDKEVRAKNVHANGNAVKDETLVDTMFDDPIYGLIVLCTYIEHIRSGGDRGFSVELAYARHSELVDRIIKGLERDLNDRKGFHLDDLDHETRDEIKEAWQDIIAHAILAPPGDL